MNSSTTVLCLNKFYNLLLTEDPDGKRPCLGDQYCPPLAFCNSKTKRCQCRHGLVGNGVTCRPGEITVAVYSVLFIRIYEGIS